MLSSIHLPKGIKSDLELAVSCFPPLIKGGKTGKLTVSLPGKLKLKLENWKTEMEMTFFQWLKQLICSTFYTSTLP